MNDGQFGGFVIVTRTLVLWMGIGAVGLEVKSFKFAGIAKRHGGSVRNVRLLENDRHVCMSDKAVAAGEVLKTAFRQRLFLPGQVFPERAIGASMHERAFAHIEAFGQVGEKLAVLRG